jgi:hypothetical protein
LAARQQFRWRCARNKTAMPVIGFLSSRVAGLVKPPPAPKYQMIFV